MAHYKPLFRAGLKLLGLFLILDAVLQTIPLLVGPLYSMFAQNTQFQVQTNELLIGLAMRNAAPLAQAAAGVYLMSNRTEWLVRLAIPTDRPRCPDCAYDLTGCESKACPECGCPILEGQVRPQPVSAVDDEDETT